MHLFVYVYEAEREEDDESREVCVGLIDPRLQAPHRPTADED